MSPKLLWISRIGYSCSYSYVSELILPLLKDEWDLYVFCVGITHIPEKASELELKLGINKSKIYLIESSLVASNLIEDLNFFSEFFSGISHISHIIDQIKPDIIVCLDDISNINTIYSVVKDTKIPFVPYLTIDFLNIPKELVPIKFSNVILMTNFGEKEIKKLIPNINSTIIPHIIDPTSFYPLDKISMKKKWINNSDLFVVGSFNANNIRKRWDLVISGFCMFAKSHPNVILIIKIPYKTHKKINNIYQYDDYDFNELILSICKMFDFDHNRIKILEDDNLSQTELNELYNCCDVGLVSPYGEGWGLTPCEMAMCEIPQIVPKWGSFLEIFPDSKGLVPVKTYPHSLRNSAEFSDIDNTFSCIFKSYLSSETKTTTEDELKISLGISTIIISPHYLDQTYPINGVQIINHSGSISSAIDYIEICDKLPDRLQILICNNPNFIKNQNGKLSDIIDILSKDHRRNYVLNQKSFNKKYDLSLGVVGICPIKEISKKLEEFYSDPNLREETGKYNKQRILEICNKKNLLEKFNDFLRQICQFD